MAHMVLKFENAIREAKQRYDQVSVLLGNGFSIDYDSSRFRYDALLEEADLSRLSVNSRELFEVLGTKSFEEVVDKLGTAAKLQRLYGSRDVVKVMMRDLREVRNGLAEVLARLHPNSAQALTASEVRCSRAFLGRFDRIFTLNYDLLLYWAITRTDLANLPAVRSEDGFQFPTFQDHSRLVWKPRLGEQQRIFYLHGAFHLFVEDRRLTKLRFARHGRLVDEIRTRIQSGQLPKIITEGTNAGKAARISNSPYLSHALRRFGEIEGALFVHGASLAENDQHIFEPLESPFGELRAVYVSLYGDPDRGDNPLVRDRAHSFKRRYEAAGGPSLRLRFYDAESARIWR